MSLTIELDEIAKDVAPLYASVKTNHRTDSGFDIFMPFDMDVPEKATKMLDLGIRCQPSGTSGYYLYPRSSISKTPLRLANSIGVIDSGYRGNYIAVFDNCRSDAFKVERLQRLVQICPPNLTYPMKVLIVDDFGDAEATARGTGGFGSTGN